MSPGLKQQAILLAERSESRLQGKEDTVRRLGKDVRLRRQKEGTPMAQSLCHSCFADVARGKATEPDRHQGLGAVGLLGQEETGREEGRPCLPFLDTPLSNSLKPKTDLKQKKEIP